MECGRKEDAARILPAGVVGMAGQNNSIRSAPGLGTPLSLGPGMMANDTKDRVPGGKWTDWEVGHGDDTVDHEVGGPMPSV